MTPMDVGDVTGGDFKAWLMVIAGNVAIVILVWRAIGHWALKEWGALIGHMIVAVVVVFLIYANDQAIALLKQIAMKIFG